MNQFITLIFFIIPVLSLGQTNDPNKIYILVTVPQESDEVYITGNRPELGSWIPDQVKLQRIAPLKRGVLVEISGAAEFKFTRGDWHSQAVVNSFGDFSNLKLPPTSTDTVRYSIKGWSDYISEETICTEYLIRRIPSTIFEAEQTIEIFVPESYHPETAYPVMYVMDGNLLFKPTVNVVRQLVAFDLMPASIIVGVFHQNRDYELAPNMEGGFSEGSKELYAYLTKDLLPYIDNRYHSSGFNVLVGHSNSATFVHQVLLEKESPFRGFIGMSQGLFGNQLSAFEQLISKKSGLTHYYFVSSGKKDAPLRWESGEALEALFVTNPNPGFQLEHQLYDAGHIDLVAKSLDEGLLSIFSDYSHVYDFEEDLIDSVVNSGMNPLSFVEGRAAFIRQTYGIDFQLNDDDFSFMLACAIDLRDKEIYEEIDRRKEEILGITAPLERYSLKAQAYEAMGEYEDALAFWKQHIEEGGYTDNVFYFERPYKLIYEKQKDPEAAIEFLEYAKTRYPDGKYLFAYYIAKVAAESNIQQSTGLENIQYSIDHYQQNWRFTLEEAEDLKNRLE